MEIARLVPGESRGAAVATTLLNREMGENLYQSERLLRDATDPTALVLLADDWAGVAVSRLLVPEDASYYERFGPEATGLFAGEVGSFEALAVEPARRRRGIGAALTTASIDWMRDQGCDAVVTLSWLSGRPDTSTPLFRRLGFREGRTVVRFYYEESRRDSWTCPVCGGPCTCSATFFWLELI
jgi:GNAT superfamily N-acetyltransferase